MAALRVRRLQVPVNRSTASFTVNWCTKGFVEAATMCTDPIATIATPARQYAFRLPNFYPTEANAALKGSMQTLKRASARFIFQASTTLFISDTRKRGMLKVAWIRTTWLSTLSFW
jgi:hypothetical protein